MQTVLDSQWRKRLSRHTAVKFPFAPLSAKAQPSTFACRNQTANNCARHRARYRWQLKRSDQHRRTLPCGVTVTQPRKLSGLFLVRIQAGQPRKRLRLTWPIEQEIFVDNALTADAGSVCRHRSSADA